MGSCFPNESCGIHSNLCIGPHTQTLQDTERRDTFRFMVSVFVIWRLLEETKVLFADFPVTRSLAQRIPRNLLLWFSQNVTSFAILHITKVVL